MLFDPDDGKTWEEIFENELGRMCPEDKAQLMAATDGPGGQ